MMHRSALAAAACLLGSAAAFPAADVSARGYDEHAYVRPLPSDSRAPCPGLNTLANHGYLPHDGRNVTRNDIIDGFLDGFGLDESVIDGALFIAFQVCKFVNGADCGDTLNNLTMLAEPHIFEHDMSLSRQDYHMAYSGADHFDNNQNFNMTMFQKSLDVVGDNTHIDYSLFQEVRLTRESEAVQDDLAGWFMESRVIQLTEVGFQFGFLFDPKLANFTTEPKIRVDWWKYWFINESFPTPLGWRKPNPPQNISFIESVSERVQTAPITSTPPFLPATYTNTGSSPGAVPTAAPATILPVPSDPPYSPNGPVIKKKRDAAAAVEARAAVPGSSPAKRAAQPHPTAVAHYERLQSAETAVGTRSVFFNPYKDKVDAEQLAAIAAYNQDRVSKVQSAYAALTAAH